MSYCGYLWGDSRMIFTCDCVTRENICRIGSLDTSTSTSVSFYIHKHVIRYEETWECASADWQQWPYEKKSFWGPYNCFIIFNIFAPKCEESWSYFEQATPTKSRQNEDYIQANTLVLTQFSPLWNWKTNVSVLQLHFWKQRLSFFCPDF